MQISVYHHSQNKPKGLFPKLLAIFIIIPLIEIYLLIKIGQYIGALNTIIIIVITGLLGAVLMKLEGLRVWSQFQKDLAQMRMPKDGLIDGLLILIGGVFLITPGVLTDIAGFLLIIPWSRHLVRDYLKRKLSKKFFGQHNIIDV